MKKINYGISNLKIKREKSSFDALHFLLILITFLLLFTVNMMAQDIDLSRAKGEIIAQGTNETLVEGDGFKVKSYRLENIPLPESAESVLEGRKQKTTKVVAIRLVITGEFPSGNYAIWINGVPNSTFIGVDGNPQLNSIGSGKMFEENSEIAISGGGIGSKRVLLPEPFRVPSYLQRPARSKDELRRNVRLTYVGCDGSGFATKKDCVQIVIRNPFLADDMSSNHGWYLQIGDKEFAGGADSFIISVKEFERLKDGEWVVIKTARGIYGGAMVGILDKSSLR